jgi:hypothetical protein
MITAVSGFWKLLDPVRLIGPLFDKEHNVESAAVVMAAAMLIYVFFGLLFAWRAKCRFRRNVF